MQAKEKLETEMLFLKDVNIRVWNLYCRTL